MIEFHINVSVIYRVKNSQIYKYFVTQKIRTPVSQNKWIKYYPFLEHVDWKKYTCYVYVYTDYAVQDLTSSL